MTSSSTSSERPTSRTPFPSTGDGRGGSCTARTARGYRSTGSRPTSGGRTRAGGLTYELEVGKVVKEMLSGKVIRYGEVNNERRWSFTKEQSLAGFSEIYEDAAGCFKARQNGG